MARDLYETTIALPDATGTMKALSGVKVSVVPRGAVDVPNALVNVYVSDTGVTRGPDPKSGATGTNPIITGSSGSVRFWAEGPYEYDLVIEDTMAPARIVDRIGWNAVPAKPGAIPTSYLAEDGGITQKMLSAKVIEQQVAIGQVIDWWRPVGSVQAKPNGFEFANGQIVSQHDFAGVQGSIVLPDLQNCFILGASLNKADQAGADQGDAPSQGPGIRGPGGSNAGKNLAHFHVTGMGGHVHGVSVGNHYHGAGSLAASDHTHHLSFPSATMASALSNFNKTDGTKVVERALDHYHWVIGDTGGATALAVGGNTDWGGAFAVNTGGPSVGSVNSNGASWDAYPGVDYRPRFYGLLRLIKVRRT